LKVTFIALLAGCLAGCATPVVPAYPSSLAQQKLAAEAHRILVQHCRQCHGAGTSQSGEMLLEFEALIRGRFIRRGMRGDPSCIG